MPALTTYPGIYIEEISSGVRTITGVATSITAFIGRALRGPVNEPTVINNYGDFENLFGGLDADCPLSYAVQDFFNNGGAEGIIVRLYHSYSTDNTAREDALSEAKEAANAVRDATTGPTAADAANAAKTANDTIIADATSTEAALLAAQAVADAAQAEADRSVYGQRLAISGDPDGGTFKLTFNGSETSDIQLTDLIQTESAAAEQALKDALEALPSIGTGNIRTVERGDTTPNYSFAVTFAEAVGSPGNVMTLTNNSLTGGAGPTVSIGTLPDAGSVAATATAEAGSGNTNGPAVVAAADEVVPAIRARLILSNDLIIEAATPGAWGDSLEITVDHDTKTDDDGNPDETLFNLTITDPVGGNIEKIRNVSGEPDAVRLVNRVLTNESSLVQVVGTPPASRPAEGDYEVDSAWEATDSEALGASDYLGSEDNKTGLYALEKADLFNLLCIPPDTREGNTDVTVYQGALTYCTGRRAMLLVDSPAEWAANPDTAAAKAIDGLGDLGLNGPATRNAALFFPRIEKADLMRESQIDTFVPCGAIAGIFGRTDSSRGVWKAPAGIDAAIYGIAGLQATLTDAENGQLNPLGINCLRSKTLYGLIVWGARTLRGADSMADDYKYIPVRRTALYIEESLYRGTQWVVFEPNDEPLWAQIRLNVGAFMHTLFRQGAFQGTTPKDAYLVKCDSETTTQDDINRGVVNILVGFAPLKPAEFVIIKIQQMAGEIET
jgi:Bacteriophage tail sheath protein